MTQSGSLLNNRYRLLRHLASGGMGAVWVGHDELLDRDVAIKIMKLTTDEPEFAERFRAEARNSAGLGPHPHVVMTHDFGEQGDVVFLVMELVDGESLAELLRASGPLSPSETVRILRQAALALNVAHEAGVVHRDVKPGNIMVNRAGEAKLMDFGIARAADAVGHTKTGELVGTPHYISPEQALGRPATALSDIYALGVVGHELLTGRRPFDQTTPVDTALAHINDAPPPLPDSVPAGLVALITACLAKEPGQRPQSAALLAERLAAVELTVPQGAPVPAAQTVVLGAGGPAGESGVRRDQPSDARAADLPGSVTSGRLREVPRHVRPVPLPPWLALLVPGVLLISLVALILLG